MRVTTALLFTFCVIFATANSRQEARTDVGTLQIPKRPHSRPKNEDAARDCFGSLLHIQRAPLTTTNCCLTILCQETNMNGEVWKNITLGQVSFEKLLLELCQATYLSRETASACGSDAHKQTTERSIGSYVQAGDSRERDREIRFENITKISARISGLQFLDVPEGDEMRVHNLRLEEEYLLFEVFSGIMGYLQPAELPTDLVRDALQKQVPFHLLAFQILKTEFAILGFTIFWTVAAFSVPCLTLSYFCCSKRNLHRLEEDESEIFMDFRARCIERTLTILILFFLALLIFPIILIFLGNEQISRQMARSVATTNLIFDDLDTFTRNTHMQMSFVATSSTDIIIETISKDLEDVEQLLGVPFQKELAQETGLETALDNLEDLKFGADEITLLASQLLDDCALAANEGSLLREKLKEVSKELAVARQQCRSRDRPLCYTLQYTGLEVTFSCENLSADSRMRQLQQMQREKSLGRNVARARTTFKQLPHRVSRETISHVADIKNVLNRKRTDVYESAQSLDELSRSLSNSIRTTQQAALRGVETLNRWELWRWLSVLGISTMAALVWGLLLCGAPCGCGTTSRTIPFLLSGVGFASLICLLVWSLGIVGFLFGVHGQALVCQPLYDENHYQALGEILRKGGILHKGGGGFETFLKANDTLKIEDVLKSCQVNQPAYSAFHLHNFFDTNSVTNYAAWPEFRTAVSNFTIAEPSLEILGPSLQSSLQFLATASSLNLTSCRTKISGSLTKKDLASFADQLTTVSRQLTDPMSSRRIDEVAGSVRKIIQNELRKLGDLRDRILFKMTAIELMIRPLSRQARRSLTQLEEVQGFMGDHGEEIAQRRTAQFISRLEGHLEDFQKHISTKITQEVGRCRPLWDVFNAVRFGVCKLIVDPTNGISASSFALTLLFLGIVIVVLNLVEHYRELNEELLTSITHRRARDGLVIDDEGTWATPSSESPPDAEMRDNNGQSGQATWATPNSRQSVELLIPPALRASTTSRVRSPKRLSTIASRISAARVPQIPSISRARSPKRGRHESLRLIEPTCWRSGSLSPRSWL